MGDLQSLKAQLKSSYEQQRDLMQEINKLEHKENEALAKSIAGKYFKHQCWNHGEPPWFEYQFAKEAPGNGWVLTVCFSPERLTLTRTNIQAKHFDMKTEITGAEYIQAREQFYAEARALLEEKE